MKRFLSLFTMTTLCLLMMAQGKLTPQAQMSIARQKAGKHLMNSSRKAADNTTTTQTAQRMTLVVEIADDQPAIDGEPVSSARTTFAKIKAAGATIYSRLGNQAVINLPIDSMDALQRIDGVVRIDKGHHGHMKSDVTRRETGVTKLNGGSVGEGLPQTTYTGKGVTICLMDAGFDFKHPAFKDAEGRSRIKCVYMMGDNGGNKFTVNDPEAGDYTFPGSVYDTPELIATLTTDDPEECHGTHTAGIAGGSLSPQGFGGMAPEADLVLIPLKEIETEEFNEMEPEQYIELVFAFANAYAQQSKQPMVFSASINSHSGPHDGTSTVTKAIETLSETMIPVFSAGNEGGYPIHLYQKFSNQKQSINTILIALEEDETGKYQYHYFPEVVGYTRTGSEVSIQLTLKSINQFTGRLTTVWTSEKCTATLGCQEIISLVSSDDDATLAKYFEGQVMMGAFDNGDGRLCIGAAADGGMKEMYLFQLTVSGTPGTEVDLWDNLAGFGGTQMLGLPGFVDGDSDMSAGDWTSTERVVSVGAYCANILSRDYDGQVTDTSKGTEDADVLNALAWFSSHGTSFNGVSQPTVCAPGVNIVSSYNHYYIADKTVADGMQWQGFPYGAESGTSMSCPAVAGIIALWLQANPTLTIDDVKTVMANTSRTDLFTTSVPEYWGYGKIDAAIGIDYIKTHLPYSSIHTSPFATRPSTITNSLYDLQGRRIYGRPVKGMYIENGKKVIR